MNYLKAVFWDYPKFTDEDFLLKKIRESNPDVYRWFLSRFLEYGRAIDTIKYFTYDEIRSNLGNLKLRPYTREKWKELIELHDTFEGR